MPVHILFLQLIIDPACSVIFEAEPIEDDAMRLGPRRAGTRLFGRAVLTRALIQGSGLLLVVLAVFAIARTLGASDDAARGAAFCVLVLSNVALIHASRAWSVQAGRQSGAGNPAFPILMQRGHRCSR
ncbi:cation transporting ATPase C-terminal domain-containing protein [Massilia sp. B-10]|nr:cation transporting ATPase C-terminal domain-containing protein [Massilia sp. B-10]